MRIRQLFILGVVAALVAGCTPPTVPDPDVQSGSSGTTGTTADTDSMSDGGMEDGEFFAEDPMTMVIYFDFDQSDLRAEYSDVLARHAAGLSNDNHTSMRLEGHADERGSREYNIGLGERRSQAVRRMLLLQGGSSDQISTVSFGEERPAAFGGGEDSYQQNRPLPGKQRFSGSARGPECDHQDRHTNRADGWLCLLHHAQANQSGHAVRRTAAAIRPPGRLNQPGCLRNIERAADS